MVDYAVGLKAFGSAENLVEKWGAWMVFRSAVLRVSVLAVVTAFLMVVKMVFYSVELKVDLACCLVA